MIFKTILDTGVPPQYESKIINEVDIRKTEKICFWRNKKWCGRILYKFIQISDKSKKRKFSKNNNLTEAISSIFLNNYNLLFLESFLAILFKSNSSFISRKLLYYSLKYIFHSVNIDSSYKILQQYLDQILFDFLIPLITLSANDKKLWKNDPELYFRRERNNNLYSFGINIKIMAMNLIEVICGKLDINYESFLLKFVKYSEACMMFNIDPRTTMPCSELLNDGLLWTLGKLKRKILCDVFMSAKIEYILEKHVKK